MLIRLLSWTRNVYIYTYLPLIVVKALLYVGIPSLNKYV